MSAPSTMFRWDGRGMMPLIPARAAQLYHVGEIYRLEETQERSVNSHNHFFAALQEAFKNLPEQIAENFVNFNHFRKWCLIATGYRDETKIVTASHDEALALASVARRLDEFAVVEIIDAVVTIYVAKSQSVKEMGPEEFKASKAAVLDYAAGLVGVTADDLRRNVAKAA